jgi:hypothetical protein
MRELEDFDKLWGQDRIINHPSFFNYHFGASQIVRPIITWFKMIIIIITI